jgi:23S rRNA (cytosine1962-C5)-methyltransferase
VNRREVWPALRDACIVHADDALVVVAKPAYVPTQAADPSLPDDIVTRVKEHLGLEYLGVHQRLDRDTSGLLVFARSKDANPSLAKQFEGRAVKKTYVAGVVGWPKEKSKTTLRDVLVEGDDGRMAIGNAKTRNGQQAITHVRVLGRRGDRALLELELETGRMHQARVQLAGAGCPIAGDVLYGGPAAPRLLLHAKALAFTHPTTGAAAHFEAKVPGELEAWLAHGDLGEAIYDDAPALRRAIANAVERRYGLARSEGGARSTTAFRLINEGGDALPGLAVDVYGHHLVAQFYEDPVSWPDERRGRLLDALHTLGFDGIYEKRRPRQANVIVDARREEFAPKLPVRGTAAPDDFAIEEEGVPYQVRLADGLSTGIFLDQRENRRRVRAGAGGLSVLNLFAYTCGFSLAAAMGGAVRTVSVDAATNVLERGRQSFTKAGLDLAGHTFVADDVFSWIRRAAK